MVSDYVLRYIPANVNIRVRIAENASGGVLDLTNLQQYRTSESLVREDRSLRTFLEMGVSMQAVNRNMYIPVGAGKAFETIGTDDRAKCGNGMVLRRGLAKGVRIVKNDGNVCPALVLDCKFGLDWCYICVSLLSRPIF